MGEDEVTRWEREVKSSEKFLKQLQTTLKNARHPNQKDAARGQIESQKRVVAYNKAQLKKAKANKRK